jgi:uncharacterized protein YjbI with pentapeptide repeats
MFTDCRHRDLQTVTLSPAIDISRCEGENAVIGEGNIAGIVCKQGNLRMSSFRETKANNGRFLMSDLAGACFQKCQLKKADFSGIMGKGIIFYECDLREAKFEGAYLDGAMFCKCNCTKADFKRAFLRNGNMRDNDLSFADFYLSDMRDIYFCDDNITAHTMGLWSDLEILKTVKGTITAYRLQTKNKTPGQHPCHSPFHGVVYEEGKVYEVEFLSNDRRIGCAEGLHVAATKDWAISAGLEDFGITDNIPNFDLYEADINMPVDLVAPIDKGRFRVRKFTIRRKMDLKEWWP